MGIVEPLAATERRAAGTGKSVMGRSIDTDTVREAFGATLKYITMCDVVICNLTEASMTNAVELWEAQKSGAMVMTVSPILDDWLLRSVSDHNFASLEELESQLYYYLP